MSRFLQSQTRGAALSLPSARDEAWRYTSLKALEQRALGVGDPDAAMRAVPDALLEPGVARLVFVNGALRTDLSAVAIDGVTVTVTSHVADGAAPGEDDALARLNRLLARERVALRVAAGRRVAAPIHLVHIGAPASEAVAWYARIGVELDEGATLGVVERYVAAAPHEHVGNVALELRIGSGASLAWTRLQTDADAATLFARTAVTIGGGARFEHANLDLGALLARHALDVTLAAPGASLRARGVFALRGRQHADTQLAVVHAARDTHCDIAYRGLADGRARGVFGGAITMQPGADGADARLENKNLLLSPHAEIDTKPVLEIHADEVKASHGATVGQLDERALFYLRSRGISEPEARSMLTYAFAAAMFESLPERDRLLAPLTAGRSSEAWPADAATVDARR